MSTPVQNSVQPELIVVSGDPFFAPLLSGARWEDTPGGTALTYSFPISSSVWAIPYSELGEPSGFQPFGSTDIAAARIALQTWVRYADISFSETSDNQFNVGDIRFAYTTVSTEGSAAHAYYPSPFPSAADIWLESADVSGPFEPGSPGFLLLLHEIGHALGLKHPFEASSQNPATLDPDFDSLSYTVMSYNLYRNMPISDYAASYFPTTPMALDILALQAQYGVKSFNLGNTEYIYSEYRDYFETIYDTGGNDTIIYNSVDQFAIIDLDGGSWSSLGNPLVTYDAGGEEVEVDIYNVMIFYDTVIENATSGASDDELYGNGVANRLEAGGGHDIVMGDGGADTVLGGSGNDHLYGQSPSGGADGADNMSGGEGGDYIQGNAGNDLLDGGVGSDRINGGNNDDNIVGGADNDTINGNVGSDTIVGGEGNDSLRGGQGADAISGGTGNDIVSGDLAADRLSGGEGSDLFAFSGASSSLDQPDRILDYADGTDRISIGFLPAAVLTASSQSGLSPAATTAQQLFDGREGNGEVAALMIGSDTYLFYAANGGAAVDSAILILGTNAQLFDITDFG